MWKTLKNLLCHIGEVVSIPKPKRRWTTSDIWPRPSPDPDLGDCNLGDESKVEKRTGWKSLKESVELAFVCICLFSVKWDFTHGIIDNNHPLHIEFFTKSPDFLVHLAAQLSHWCDTTMTRPSVSGVYSWRCSATFQPQHLRDWWNSCS